MIAILETFVVSFLSLFAAIIGIIFSTIGLATDLIDMSRDIVDSEIRMFRMEVTGVLLNALMLPLQELVDAGVVGKVFRSRTSSRI